MRSVYKNITILFSYVVIVVFQVTISIVDHYH